MKRTIALIPFLFIVGCASTEPQKAPEPVVVNAATKPDFSSPVKVVDPIDQKCAALAKKARAIALVRDSGAPMDDVQLLVARDAEYPLQPMIREVYARNDISASDGASNSYAVCTKVGYETMVSALLSAEATFIASEVEKTKAALAIKKAAKKPVVKHTVKPAVKK